MHYHRDLSITTISSVIKKLMVLGLLLVICGCNEDGSNSATSAPVSNSATSAPVSDAGEGKYNFVIILTDDQRWETLSAMPIVQDKLAARGVTFTNAFVSTPVCSPSRASLLAGGFYAHNTGVLTNGLPTGGVEKFKDNSSLATMMQQAGYKTALIGKYLNGYYNIDPYIPPGWTQFVTSYVEGENNKYTGYNVTRGTSGMAPAQGETTGPIEEYITDFENREALAFLEEFGASPFFLVLNHLAPHLPALASAEDAYLFLDYLHRGRAYGEDDVSDKPRFIQSLEMLADDATVRKQLSSLQAVDRSVGAIFDRIEQMGKLDRTVFIYTSDNGYLWGEHRCWAKGRPYEESLRVPFVLVMPGIQPRTDDHLVVANLDIGPTILELAENARTTDGLSLVPILRNSDAPWRRDFLIENFGFTFLDGRGYLWAGLRTKDQDGEWKYVEYGGGEKELYDLVNDPYEAENLSLDPAHQETMAELAAKLDASRGLAIYDVAAPQGIVGEKYTFQITARGGKQPYSWSIVKGILPQGLTFDEHAGLISGTPAKVETREIAVEVRDSSVSAYTALPQSHSQTMFLTITKPSLSSALSVTLPPKADAGGSQSIQSGLPVTLDGSRSSDRNGPSLSFEWRQTVGIPVILSNPSHVSPVFTAPPLDYPEEILVFELTVTDRHGLTATDTAVIRVTKPL